MAAPSVLVMQYQGARETAIRERFDMSPTRYYQVLNALIGQPAALAYDPMGVKRLQRLRDRRATRRRRCRYAAGSRGYSSSDSTRGSLATAFVSSSSPTAV